MSQYMLLICNPPEGLSPEELRAEHPKWMAYTEALGEAGALVEGNALEAAARGRLTPDGRAAAAGGTPGRAVRGPAGPPAGRRAALSSRRVADGLHVRGSAPGV
jgi:hypothetical protein